MTALLSFWFIKPKHRKALRWKKKKKRRKKYEKSIQDNLGVTVSQLRSPGQHDHLGLDSHMETWELAQQILGFGL